jgi:Cys-tRNA(Pro)/Cys-tRNA(Cys) deacylase
MDALRSYLKGRKIDAELIDMGNPMTTARAAADLLKLPVGNIFKSLVLIDAKNSPLIVVLPGGARLDQKALARLVGTKKLKFASAEVVLEVTGYPPGGTPPLGHKTALPVYVDEKIMAYEFGYGGGGHPNWLLRIRPQELVRTTGATIATLSQ